MATRAEEFGQGRVTPRECRAARLLARDGWSYRELGLALERKPETLSAHVNRRCEHVSPVREVPA